MGINSGFKGLSLIFEYFSNICRENLGFITLTSIMGTLHEYIMGTLHEYISTFMISHLVCVRMRNVSDKIVEKIKTHVLF